jgi:hypothetical protein
MKEAVRHASLYICMAGTGTSLPSVCESVHFEVRTESYTRYTNFGLLSVKVLFRSHYKCLVMR